MSMRIKVSAPFALFERPELTRDKCSYDIMPPSAARGVLESVYWHPGMAWTVDRITVVKPIKFVDLTPESGHRTIALRNVEYVIDAHFDMTKDAAPGDNPGKFQDIIRRRLERGDYYSKISLGSNEYPAAVEKAAGKIESELKGIKNLGFMLYGFDYSVPDTKAPIFFRATLKNGILDLTNKPTLLLK